MKPAAITKKFSSETESKPEISSRTGGLGVIELLLKVVGLLDIEPYKELQ